MEISAEKIFADYRNGYIDKGSYISLLVDLAENCDIDDIRLKCIEELAKIQEINDKFYYFLENLIVSDSSWQVRSIAINYVVKFFGERAYSLIKWALNNECDYNCIVSILEALISLNNDKSKKILQEELIKITKKEFLFEDKNTTNKAFRKDIKNLLKNRNINDFSHKELGDIIINFYTIVALKRKFYSVYYELENALVKTLDLSDIEFEVRGWKAEFKNNIKSLKEITGLRNLKALKHLYLSNNQIKSLKELEDLKNLTHLYIANNLIDDIENLDYLKKLDNLKFLDISKNRIADKIDEKDFHFKIKNKKDEFYFY
ncbi:MAG: leucine-rich repeat domain-containing protein [Promethearchaeota archaeon]